MLPVIAGGFLVAVGAFELGRRMIRSSKTQKIALRGKMGSGKTTLIHLLRGDVEELKKARMATASTPNEASASVEGWFEAYEFYDTVGNKDFHSKNEQVQEKCDMTLYVFNPLEFSQEILKELRANKNFTKLKAIGTRADKLDEAKERDIRAQIA
ncbi:GTPase [Campylobacter sp. VTCC 70190]|uniref:GTPase n=1 Tax=Campylobacter sp. VTCC 70190 TaxID=3392118 RepID=UPI00398E5A4F